MRILLALVVSGLVLSAAPVDAVVVGNPGCAIGKGEIALGLESERFEDVFDSDDVNSQRFLAKFGYGLTESVNLFAKCGTGALNIATSSHAASSEFAGDSQLAIGGGFHLESNKIFSLGGCRFFTSVQWLQFKSGGEFLREETYKDWTWEERLETAYQWKEFGAAAGLSRSFQKFSVYGGLTFTRVSGRVDQEQFVLSESSSVNVGTGSEEFHEGPNTGLLVGLDYDLSGSLSLSTAYQLNGRRHGSLFIGISETME